MSLYGRYKWRQRAKKQLSKEPLCAECYKLRKLSVATQADHITPWNTESEFWNGPLQSLCHSCHSIKSNKESILKKYETKKRNAILKKTAITYL